MIAMLVDGPSEYADPSRLGLARVRPTRELLYVARLSRLDRRAEGLGFRTSMAPRRA